MGTPRNPWRDLEQELHFRRIKSLIDQVQEKKLKALKKITRSDTWLDPFCCREGQEFLEGHPSAAVAWERCFRPDFLCWFLDVFRDKVPDFDVTSTTKGTLATRTPWRLILYRDFLTYQMELPPVLVSLVLWAARKSLRFSLWLFWFVTGYFDAARGSKTPAAWWLYTATDIKGLYQGVRGFLSEAD